MALYKKGKNWYMDYRYPPGREGKRIREKIGPVTKDEATIVLSTRLKDILIAKNPELRRITPKPFKDMVKEFLERHASKLKDYGSAKQNTDTLIRYFGSVTLQEITPKAIEDFITARLAGEIKGLDDEGVEEATTNRQRACLSKIFNCAITWGYYGGENPVRMVKAFKESPGRVRFLSGEEAAALLENAPKHLKPIIVCGLHTGGRLNEVLGLKWSDIDFANGVLYFPKTNTKSGKQREIPIDAPLAAILQERQKLRFSGGAAREYVFTFHGKQIASVRTAFNKTRTDAGLGEDVTFHTMRHTFASWYMINGGDLYVLKNYLGHSTITLTERYAHLSPARLKAGVAFFGAPAAIGGHLVDTNQVSTATAGSASA